MTTRADIVIEARSWIGTRYAHQQHTKGLATDCGGLVYGVGLSLGLLPPISKMAEAVKFAGYARQALNGSLVEACGVLLESINAEQAEPGDVVLMSFTGEPQHVGILGDYPHGGFSLIHSYLPSRKVVESRLDEVWQKRVVSYWRIPGVAS